MTPSPGAVAYLDQLMADNVKAVSAVFAFCLIAWWPLDLVLFHPEAVQALALFRSAALVCCLVPLLLPRVSRADVLQSGVAGLTLAVFAGGCALTTFGPLSDGAVLWGVAPAFFLVPALVEMRRRVLCTGVLLLAGPAGMLTARPEAWGAPELWWMIAYSLVSAALYCLIGDQVYQLMLEHYEQGRKLARQQVQLGELRGRLARAVEGKSVKLRDLAEHLRERRDFQRGWMAERVHDHLGQELAAVAYSLEYAGRVLDSDIEESVLALDRSRMLLGRARHAGEDILQGLNSPVLDGPVALHRAVSSLVGRTVPAGALEIELSVQDFSPPLTRETGVAVYRVIQEALSNILRHARATRAHIEVRRRAAEVEVIVSDDGVGLSSPGEPESTGDAGIGLVGMAERVTALGGKISVNAPADGGTRLTVWLPKG